MTCRKVYKNKKYTENLFIDKFSKQVKINRTEE